MNKINFSGKRSLKVTVFTVHLSKQSDQEILRWDGIHSSFLFNQIKPFQSTLQVDKLAKKSGIFRKKRKNYKMYRLFWRVQETKENKNKNKKKPGREVMFLFVFFDCCIKLKMALAKQVGALLYIDNAMWSGQIIKSKGHQIS